MASTTEGELDVTSGQPAAQRLRAIFDGDPRQPFEGSGCSDHVRRRNVRASVVVALTLLIVLIALLVV
ncbi:hypothetical protein [Dietzia sp. B32]|uniref:hypothetical protein n=1 Tax=Dietzia sp. B32 TaxID=2915130 RepID=UPI0021ADD5B6|nr:hypothetical protein [Dietzia sp. B32]UVE94270.1 hypothetical protein L8M95_12005 [Dietzia sp. B32]